MAVAREKPEAQPDTALSPHRVAQMVEKARWAAASFSTYSRAEVLAIARAVAEAGAAAARKYADWAVEETGFGNADHKEIKNRLCSIGLFEHYRGCELHRFPHRCRARRWWRSRSRPA